MLRLLTTLLLTCALAACTSHTAPASTTGSATPAAAATNVLAGTPMATYGHALNKAKNVQDIVNQQAAKQAAAINAATGGTH